MPCARGAGRRLANSLGVHNIVTSGGISTVLLLVALSEILSLWLIIVLWRSNDFLFFKITLTVLALVPFLGPLIAFWLRDFPSVKPRILQDRRWRGADFYDRWRYVLEERSPVRRFRTWRELMTTHRNEDP